MTSAYYKYRFENKIDYHILLFFLNALLVIVSYRAVSWGIFDLIKTIRLGLIIFSLFYLFLGKHRDRFTLKNNKSNLVIGYLILNLLLIPFSGSFNTSISRFLTFVPFVIYFNYFTVYLLKNYEKDDIKLKIIPLFAIVYFFPIINYFLTGETTSTYNLYGSGSEATGFRSNTYGWASIFFIVTAFDFISNKREKNAILILLIILLIALAGYILFISGSRSSYLCAIVSIIILLVKNKSIHPVIKVLTSFGIIYTTLFFIQDQKSAIYNRIEKTEMQLESGEESRIEMAILVLNVVMKEGNSFFHGVGFDNTEDAIYESTGIELNKAIHNSYLQIFVEGGIFVFIYFLLAFVIYPLYLYIKHDAKKFIFFPTLMIISFFESNYGAGQFLFFPWIFFMIYYIHYTSKQEIIKESN